MEYKPKQRRDGSQCTTEHRQSTWLPTPGNMLFTLVIAGLCLWIATASDAGAGVRGLTGANIPDAVVEYVGYLSNTSGEPLNGSFALSFALFDAPMAGNLVWGPELHEAVSIVDGQVAVGVGSVTDGGVSVEALTGERYIQIQVGSEVLLPRVPYYSDQIATIAHSVVDGAINTQHLADGAVTIDKLGEQPYYFDAAFATQSEWVADVIYNENYARFCEAIDRSFVRAERLVRHWNRTRQNGFFYTDWYYAGSRYDDADVNIYTNGDLDGPYNVWQYKGGNGCCVGTHDTWTMELSAIIWCDSDS